MNANTESKFVRAAETIRQFASGDGFPETRVNWAQL